MMDGMSPVMRFYAALAVSAIVLGVWVCVTLSLTPMPADDLKETVKYAVGVVIGFWIGSSSGSAAKDQRVVVPPHVPE